MITTKSNSKKPNPLLNKYHSLDETERTKVRDRIITESGVSLPNFYYIIKVGRAQKLVREVFAKYLETTVIELFPYTAG